MLQTLLDSFWTTLQANFSQIFIALATVGGTVMTAWISGMGARGANRLSEERFAFEQNEKEETNLFDRQEKLFDQTQKLVATLEHRLEVQNKEFHEEREMYKAEVKGFRRQVARLEKRVLQLIVAFRDATGREPPPAPDDKDE